MNILINGAAGHMGMEVARQAAKMGIPVCCGVDVAPAQADFPVYASFEEAPVADVAVDFSRPASLDGLLSYAVRHRVPLVLATTGYTPEQLEDIADAARVVPIFRSANMSLGVAVLRALSRRAAEILGDAYDIEIVEAHHNRKADAPSGTALMLLDAVKDATAAPHVPVYGRCGHDCRRRPAEIGMHSLRGGTVAGEHEVCFFGPSERIKLCHSAENRGVFAIGALRAAEFVIRQQPGMYDMDDMIGKL